MSPQANQQALTPRHHLVYFCSRFLAYGLPLLFFLVTCSFYLKTYDSAQVKITFTQIGTSALLFVWLAKMILEGRWPFKKEDLVYVAPFLAFLISGLVAWVHSPFKAWALEETMRRVFYMTLALITIAEMRSSERMKRLWRWLMAAAFVSIGYGLIQYLDSRWFIAPQAGIDPFIWRQAFGHRVFSTFGNPNFYGNFLVILTPLILSSVLKHKGSLVRPFSMLLITMALIFFVDKMQLGLFGGFDPSLRFVYFFLTIVGVMAFFAGAFWRVGSSGTLPMFLILFALLFLNLYATETKGAWLGFTAAVSATIWLIMEYFFHLDERHVSRKFYFVFLTALIVAITGLSYFLVSSFVVPQIQGTVDQMGFSILWIPAIIALIIMLLIFLWVIREPWNLKKIIYGALVVFVIGMGGLVLQFAKTRLLSVSFRQFTWISTWEMVRTSPLLGNGVGSFKAMYPAYRRPEIIALEGKSNTETDHAEDEYLEVWQDEGMVGFGIFLWLIVTALVCGFKQLRWYSKLRVPDDGSRRTVFKVQSDPRSYEVLGILGAYIGALIHWAVDVSVRFVSSGVFSGLLPGLLVAYARNFNQPIRHEVRLGYDRWIRLSVAGFWTVVMLVLGMELVPTAFIKGGDTGQGQIVFFILLVGVALFVLLEVLEFGIHPEADVPYQEQYSIVHPTVLPLRAMAVAALAVFFLMATGFFTRHFRADVHHNLAIFFSKNSIWRKEPKFDSMLNNFPPDIRKKYRNYGGALEHYEEVIKNSQAFPMAHYFTGNVYNDWGSQLFGEALATRQRGDHREADRIRDRALAMWDKSQNAYESTKEIAPNYVQTHHQMGLLYVKRAELAREWGDPDKMRQMYATALQHFRRYRMLDPVFVPNYDRIVQILLMDGQFDEAISLYKEALHYNGPLARRINVVGFPDRVSELSVSLAKVLISKASTRIPNPFSPRQPEIEEAVERLNVAVENNPKNGEAWKLLGLVYERTGEAVQAQQAYKKALELNPQDPDLRKQ